MAWAGVTSVLAASAASISALFGGWLVGFLVGLASAGLYLPLIAYDKPPDPVLGGVPILLVWGCGGLLAGLVTDRLRGDTRDAYASVVRQRDAQRAVARTLQEALIPEALPYLDSASAAAFYRPAGDGTELGGDFYDAWLLSDTGDRFGFALGDVCGKGAPAAAITALSRHTARTASLMGADPSTILRTLNEELHGRTSSERFVTVLIGHGERRASGLHITMATGGHPLPLIRRADGSATTIGQPGTLIGIYRNPTISQFSVTLHPGDVLLLHTDGVTDLRSPDGWFGEERLHHTLRHAPPTPSGTITAIRKALTQFTPAPPQDDIALLAFGISQPLPATPRLRASTHVLPRHRPSSGTSP
jgi:sigma-B regulation protein RsbU (phosphoserine phosphatase)